VRMKKRKEKGIRTRTRTHKIASKNYNKIIKTFFKANKNYFRWFNWL